jgi:hypothetical protein
MVNSQQVTQILGVNSLGKGRGINNVAEDDTQDPPFGLDA